MFRCLWCFSKGEAKGDGEFNKNERTGRQKRDRKGRTGKWKGKSNSKETSSRKESEDVDFDDINNGNRLRHGGMKRSSATIGISKILGGETKAEKHEKKDNTDENVNEPTKEESNSNETVKPSSDEEAIIDDDPKICEKCLEPFFEKSKNGRKIHPENSTPNSENSLLLLQDLETLRKEKKSLSYVIQSYRDKEDLWTQERKEMVEGMDKLVDNSNQLITQFESLRGEVSTDSSMDKKEKGMLGQESTNPGDNLTLKNELDSLQLVLEMRNSELCHLRRENRHNIHQIEQLNIAKDQLHACQLKIEDLRAQLVEKTNHERQLTLERAQIQLDAEETTKRSQIMSMQIEQLQWKAGERNKTSIGDGNRLQSAEQSNRNFPSKRKKNHDQTYISREADNQIATKTTDNIVPLSRPCSTNHYNPSSTPKRPSELFSNLTTNSTAVGQMDTTATFDQKFKLLSKSESRMPSVFPLTTIQTNS